MKKIMIVHNKMVVGGIERVLLSLLNSVDYTKNEIDLYLMKSGGCFFHQIPKEVNIYILNEIDVMKNYKKDNILEKIKRKILGIKRYYLPKFKKIYIKKDYDVSISFLGYDILLDLFAGLAPAKKKIIWCHGDFLALSKYTSWFENTFNIDKYKYSFFDKLIAVSETAANNFLDLYGEKYVVDYLWNRIDDEYVLKKSKEKNDVKLNGKYNIISVGRLVDDKATYRLVEVHNQLIKDGYDIKSYIIGDGPNYDSIKQLIKKNNIEDSIILLGTKSNPYNILKQADLLILPSRNEGFPTVLMEALVLGIPFVATNVCGSKDIHNYIAPKGSSILVEEDIQSIKKGVIDAINGKIKKGYFFDVKKFNEEIDKKFNNIINGGIK